MIVSKNYHSAFSDPINLKGIDRFENNKNIVLFNDIIENGIPSEFKNCDVLYSEPPFKNGFNEFCNRAKIDRSFDDYINALKDICHSARVPVFLMCGTMTAKKIGGYKISGSTRLHGYSMPIFSWNCDIIYYETKNTFDLIKNIMRDFSNIGDFCCGYGNTARVAKENKKNFVMSDYNKSCVYFVAKEYMGYVE